MPVDRCVCYDISFRELIDLARAEGLTLDQLKQRTGCCTGCTTCEPYVRIALTTGKSSLPVMPPPRTPTTAPYRD
ncbi:MAG: (2Fe-2S)-binding protein [Phycisphaerales bacterium]